MSESSLDKTSTHSTSSSEKQVVVCLEPDDGTLSIPSAWQVDVLRKSTKNELSTSITMTEIGVQLAKGTFETMQKKLNKKHKKCTTSKVEINPSPIQLNMWPLLLNSLHQLFSCDETNLEGSPANVVGIAQTGSGKTLAYCLPLVAACVHNLIFSTCPHRVKSSVHGVVICPTRELAIQVSNETKTAMKVANKMLKVAGYDTLRVESLAIYGGVDIQSQMASLGILSDANSNVDEVIKQKSVVIAATPGRLLDILKQLHEKDGNNQCSEIFGDISMIIFDEADRMALNKEMSDQIGEALDLLDSNDFVRCLVSATLPQKAKDMIDKWLPPPRVVLKIGSVNVGEKESDKSMNVAQTTDSRTDPVPKQSHKLPANLDLATIPSNLVQTLHVCANHKKPKKLITTLKRIYQTGSRTDSNKLCIVFFAQIKTLKFICTLLRKEGEDLCYVAFIIEKLCSKTCNN